MKMQRCRRRLIALSARAHLPFLVTPVRHYDEGGGEDPLLLNGVGCRKNSNQAKERPSERPLPPSFARIAPQKESFLLAFGGADDDDDDMMAYFYVWPTQNDAGNRGSGPWGGPAPSFLKIQHAVTSARVIFIRLSCRRPDLWHSRGIRYAHSPGGNTKVHKYGRTFGMKCGMSFDLNNF